ncbi:MAG: glycosyltransferase involved in cell wall biosynthesis [Saprospiraceae bacterium]|jgi:glycosyltransferase involved in cell wall biosynthesis
MKRNAKINKIALLLYGLHGGGAERIMVTLANEWVRQGIAVDFLVGIMEGPYQTLLHKDLNIFVFNKRIKGLLPHVIQYLNQHQPDILLSTIQPVNVIAALAGKCSHAKTKIVLREANSPGQKLVYRKGFLSKLYFRLLPRFSYPFADGYVSVSEGLRQEMIQFYNMDGYKIRTIYNPVVNNELYELAQMPIDHPVLQGEEDIIMAMGRVVPQKDFITLIRAFALVRKKRNCKLIILGKTDFDQTYYDSLLELARDLGVEENIHFIGFQTNPFAFLKRASVYVLSSRFEGLPGALIQALALGCRVVSTDCEHGPSEILKKGEYGILVPIGKPEAMANAIEKSFTLPQIDMTEIIQSYHHSKGTQEYLDYFESL